MKRINLTLLLFLNIIIVAAQNTTVNKDLQSQPKLVVGIVVDQMRADYISRFWNKFSDKGFKRLVNGGFLCENNTINYTQSETGPGHAAIYTGTTPSINGIVGNEWFQRDLNNMIYCVGDSTPKALLCNTITDQLHLATNFSSKTIAISLKDRASILPGGFTSNGSFWFDVSSGQFITSTYYMKALPAWLTTFNNRKLPANYMSQTWNTSIPIDQYIESTADDVPYEGLLFEGEMKPVFPHDLSKYKGKDFVPLLKTPFGNTLLKELAIETIKAEQLGKGKTPDFLAVSFSSTDYVGHNYGINAIELEDTYIKLDKDLGELLDFIESYLGKENVLIFLSADHGAANNVQYAIDHKMPAGYFDSKQVLDSLKANLNNFFGEGDFISKFNNLNVYLNYTSIQEKNLRLSEVENATASFLRGCKGVGFTTTAATLNTSDNNLAFNKLIKNGFNTTRSGDVIITLQQGWMEWEKRTGTTHGSPYNYDTHIPLIFYGWKVASGTYLPDVNITDIAPTIAHLLNIQAPNGCSGKAIPVPLK